MERVAQKYRQLTELYNSIRMTSSATMCRVTKKDETIYTKSSPSGGGGSKANTRTLRCPFLLLVAVLGGLISNEESLGFVGSTQPKREVRQDLEGTTRKKSGVRFSPVENLRSSLGKKGVGHTFTVDT
ncbi:hypothetical protein RND71_009690 [Anisodus tanguticus]|uniref:Uncharacterized protein n=1 Tax=Anisodus tanguticus TaxID=243964 RepID=A0AAE1SHS2_9SOLA|nr:hypothetical protein RND71_009690 [Anisodus tanguticus]